MSPRLRSQIFLRRAVRLYATRAIPICFRIWTRPFELRHRQSAKLSWLSVLKQCNVQLPAGCPNHNTRLSQEGVQSAFMAGIEDSESIATTEGQDLCPWIACSWFAVFSIWGLAHVLLTEVWLCAAGYLPEDSSTSCAPDEYHPAV